jgi:hypothetical protein
MNFCLVLYCRSDIFFLTFKKYIYKNKDGDMLNDIEQLI